MSFRATDFEFRYRFWFILGIFALAFLAYGLDPINISLALSRKLLALPRDADADSLDRYVRGFFYLGAGIITVGALVRSWAAAYLRSAVVHDSELHSDRLVADGPYRHLRNPLYLGTILLAVGIGLMAGRLGFLILTVGMILFTLRLILREESILLESQGESYRRYWEAVPRFLPSLRPRVPAGTGHPNWVDGFFGEIFMWACAAGMAAFAFTLQVRNYWIAFGIGFGIYFIQYLARRKRVTGPQAH